MNWPRGAELVAFDGLPREAFPVRVDLVDLYTRDRFWTTTAGGPARLHIPIPVELGSAGDRVALLITFGNGDVIAGRFIPRYP